MNVWVAEDDRELSILLVAVLRKDGHSVRAFADGLALRTALDAARGTPDRPQLVLSDHAMPHVSGLEVLRRLRERGDGLPFILITAFPSEEVLAAATELDARLLRKPFDLRMIRDAVRETPI